MRGHEYRALDNLNLDLICCIISIDSQQKSKKRDVGNIANTIFDGKLFVEQPLVL